MSAPSSNLYREAILDHARNPRNSGLLEAPTHGGRALNPLCGDEVEVTVTIEGEVIEEVGVLARGCVISQAAASMMSEVVRGRTLAEAAGWAKALQDALGGDSERLPGALETLQPLLEVRRHRSRIRCALLPWEPLCEMAEL